MGKNDERFNSLGLFKPYDRWILPPVIVLAGLFTVYDSIVGHYLQPLFTYAGILIMTVLLLTFIIRFGNTDENESKIRQKLHFSVRLLVFLVILFSLCQICTIAFCWPFDLKG